MPTQVSNLGVSTTHQLSVPSGGVSITGDSSFSTASLTVNIKQLNVLLVDASSHGLCSDLCPCAGH